MDSFNLSEDIKVMCVTADSFPDGIVAAHQKLRGLIADKGERRIFGISRPNEHGEISYKAAVEVTAEDEAAKLRLEPYTIKKGAFNSFYIKDYAEDPSRIKEAFHVLLQQNDVDPNGYCLEWYIGDNDVKCLVPLDENQSHYTGISDKM